MCTSTDSASKPFHIGAFVQCGFHAGVTWRGTWSMTGAREATTSAMKIGLTSNMERSTNTSGDLRDFGTFFNFVGGMSYVDGTWHIYLGFKNVSSESREVRFTNLYVFGDESLDINDGTITVSSSTPQYTVTASQFIPVPECSTADNGKVLKVVSGIPTWTSA